jgi:enterochelin esterase-like enzyme
MNRLFVLLLSVATGQVVFAQSGSLLDTNVPSKFFGWNRGIHVYLPPSYETQPQRHYPVLYLQDGQNVFSSAGTNAAFGWGSWELDLTVDKLSRAGKMAEIIMVAVDNSWGRREEYGGLHRAPAGPATNSAFENYETFLITELKPQIDREYRTLPEAAHTAVMGSSLGGLCSVVVAWDHPEIFGGAASLSGSNIREQTNFLNNVLKNFQGPPKPIRVYLDSGTVDSSGESDGCPLTKQIAAEFQRIGWTDENLELFTDAGPLTPEQLEQTGLRHDKWADAQTSQHNEFYWRLRAWRALTFLFPPLEPKSR